MQPGAYMTGPKGYTSNGSGNQFPGGCLMGKIDNKEFYIGNYFESNLEGKLFLKINNSPWNNDCKGIYKVIIKKI